MAFYFLLSQINANSTQRKFTICNAQYSPKGRLLQHLHKVHSRTMVKYKCANCDKVFTRKSNIKTHERRFHMNEKNYFCDQCGSAFFNKYDLLRHQSSIHYGASFACPCGKTFTRKDNLIAHKRMCYSYGDDALS